jgi:hypothetical protein
MTYLHNFNIVCINTFKRTDRYKFVERQMNRLKINCNFERYKVHQVPSKGKMISHLDVITKYYNKYKNGTGKQYLMILEDDIKFLYKKEEFNNLPKGWDILYLGGRIGQKMSNWNQEWIRMSTYDNHAYVLNLAKDKVVNEIITKGNIYLGLYPDTNWDNKEVSYDKYMIQYLHSKFKCFMMNPQMIIQAVDKSGEGEQYKNPNSMADTVHGYSIPEHYYEDDNYILKLNSLDIDLPKISLISIVGKTRPNTFMTSAINNFENLSYPSELIEWNILECVEESEDDGISYMILGYKNINYYRIVGEDDLSLGEKLNYLIQKCNSNYIVNFDMYHYYVNHSVDARIKCLLKYDYVNCLGCDNYGIYDIDKNQSGLFQSDTYQLYLPSLTFTKKYWKNKKFCYSDDETELVDNFTADRYQSLMSIPFESVIYCLVGDDLNNDKTYEDVNINYFEHWDEETQYIIGMLKKSKNNYKLHLTPEEEALLAE